MYDTITNRTPPDRDLPERAWKLEWRKRVLEGTLYDDLPYDFHQERQNSDGTGEYVPICNRKPSTRFNLCSLVVFNSSNLLFGEGRFPAIKCENDDTREKLHELMTETSLNRIMIEACRRGSIGSVLVRMRILKNRCFFDSMDTCYFTPKYKDDAPDTLEKVTERRKVKGVALRDLGYDILDRDLQTTFWFVRAWDEQDETWMVPQKVGSGEDQKKDSTRSVSHRLGFVPMVWIRNLPGPDPIDGECTFKPAIHTQIEIEYQLSQAGRGLKYSSDPTLVIKEPAAPDGNIIRSASSALIVSVDGDAKMLEIGGTASQAVIEYCQTLREYAMESINGNRAPADRVAAMQSGRAMEMMDRPLVGLADMLRITYGEEGLLRLLRMVVKASQIYAIKINEKPIGKLSTEQPISLKWNPFFPPTNEDFANRTNALSVGVSSGIVSKETATSDLCEILDVEDIQAEMSRIKSDQDEMQKQQLQLKQVGSGPKI